MKKSLQEMSRLWLFVIRAGKSRHLFADGAAIQEMAGFVMIVLLNINVGRKHCCL